MKITKKIEAEILQFMEDYWGSYLRGDLQTWASYLPDDFRNIGTTKAEIWNSKKEIVDFTEKVLDQMVGMAEARNKKTQIIPYDPYFMVHELADLFVKAEECWVFYGPIRISSLLEKTADRWKILHQHASYPDAKADEGETIAFNELKAENKKLRDAIQARTIELERKNRELEIEAALERVRARSMAMRHTSEIQEVIHTVHEELLKLNISIRGGSFIVINDDIDTELLCWGAGGTANTSELINVPHFGMPFCTNLINGLKQGSGFFTEEFTQQEKKEYFTELFKHHPWSELDNKQQQETLNSEGGYTRSCCVAKHTSIFIINQSGRKFSDEENDILKRFSKVFEQTYTRFLDLQKAEAQAREAQIEAALERVRAQTMAMHNSEDVGTCIVTMFSEVTALGVDEGTRFGIGILNHDNENNQLWTASKDGEEVKMHIGNIEMTWHPLLISARKAWKAQVPIHEYVLEGEDLRNYYQMLNDAPDYPLRIAMENLPERQFHYGFVFEHGFFYAFSPREFQPDLIRIIQRFTSLFGQTYRRYLDLVTAEAQAREAKIEAALEKVRSRTMAMRKADELHEVVTMIVERLMDLGVILDANGVILCTYFPDSKDVLHWIASPDFSFTGSYLLPYFDHPIFSAAWESRTSGVDYWSKSFSVEEKNSFFEYAFEHSDYKKFPDEFKQWVFQNDKHSLSFAWTKNAAILIPSHTGVVPAGEDVEILKRFANVFEQAYVRFMDLQTKEEQAVKILEEKQRLEKTLHDLRLTQQQLIQSEKLASLGELTAGIAHEIQNPLNFVNNFAEMSVELAEELKEELEKEPMDKELVKELMTDLTSNQQKINHHGKRAASIVTGMLQHSRTSTGTKEPTDLNALADEYLRLAYHGLRAKDSRFNAKMETDFDPSVGKVDVIPQDIGRVFLNIINNAFYATQQQAKDLLGFQNLTGLEAYEPTVTISSKKENGQVIFKIKDNGTGIPDHVKDKILQPFFTTKPTGQGTGLGLSLAYDIVTKGHGGALDVESEEGMGTEFVMRLPSSDF